MKSLMPYLVAALALVCISLAGLMAVLGVGPGSVPLLVAGAGAAFLVPLLSAKARLRALAGQIDLLREAVASLDQQLQAVVAALEASPDGAVVIDRQGNIAFMNASAASFLGRTKEELKGRPLTWFLPYEQVVKAVTSVHRGQREAVAVIDSFHGRPLQIRAFSLGGDERCLIHLRDVGEARLLQRVRRDFVANVSHELRSPLASLRAALETLQGGAINDPKDRDTFLTLALQEVVRLQDLVNGLLELSTLETGIGIEFKEGVKLEEVVQKAVESQLPRVLQAGLKLQVDIGGALPPVRADPERLQRAVINLLDNAIKFTPAGGRITVAAYATDEGVAIRVEDTGIGIDHEERERIFERFYRSKRARQMPGAGLGLAIVKHVVEAHGGKVWADALPEGGSAFTVVIPVSS